MEYIQTLHTEMRHDLLYEWKMGTNLVGFIFSSTACTLVSMVGNPPTYKDYIMIPSIQSQQGHSASRQTLTETHKRTISRHMDYVRMLSRPFFGFQGPRLSTTYKSFHMEFLAGNNNSIVLVDDIFSFTVGFESTKVNHQQSV